MLHEKIDIWQGLEYTSKKEGFRPVLETYILDGKESRGAVVICPGGGYGELSDREAEPIAIRFLEAGYHAFVLYYSTAPNRQPQQLKDATRAMCIIRDNAEKWGVNKDKIAIIGFSAGGHLAGSLGTLWNRPYLLDVPGMEPGKNKPNALILSYPVITSGEFTHRETFINLLGEDAAPELFEEYSLEKQVSDDTPPTFLWHTFADEAVPVENSLLFANALRKNNIPFEMHIYPRGRHGLATGDKETCSEDWFIPNVSAWVKACTNWLETAMGELEYYKW